MTEEEKQIAMRDFAEKIIAGEYSSVVVAIMSPEGKLQTFFDGGAFMSLGIVEKMKMDLLMRIAELG